MAMKLYWGSGSPYSWRALLALEVKKLPYESILLEFSKKQNKAPAYLALNPRGEVPTLRDGDDVVRESIAIMAYLDQKHPEPRLFGRGARETALVWQTISEFLYHVEPNARAMIRLFFGKAAEKTKEIRAAAEGIHKELSGFEARAAKSGWLAGDTVTAADLVVFPFIMSILRASAKNEAKPLELGFLPFDGRYPALAAWHRLVEALPGYDRAYPPHWKEAGPTRSGANAVPTTQTERSFK